MKLSEYLKKYFKAKNDYDYGDQQLEEIIIAAVQEYEGHLEKYMAYQRRQANALERIADHLEYT
jgi:hypothetical protein